MILATHERLYLVHARHSRIVAALPCFTQHRRVTLEAFKLVVGTNYQSLAAAFKLLAELYLLVVYLVPHKEQLLDLGIFEFYQLAHYNVALVTFFYKSLRLRKNNYIF